MPTGSRWPSGAKAAISFTMDNLGEAQDVNKGLWPADEPVGQHFSVKQNLPRMLDILDEHGIKATYFVESWSLDVYPGAVKDMIRRGHEIAWHGYQHETWSQLSTESEELNFQKSFAAAKSAGIEYEGFRPPGGTINDRTYGLFKEYGIKYVSPLGDLGLRNGVVILPFEWKGVDAFYYMDKFSGIRTSHGEQKDVLPPSAFKDYLLSKIQQTMETGGYISILFHPFLQESEEKFAVLEEVLQRLGSDGEIWVAPCNQVCQWVLDHPDLFV